LEAAERPFVLVVRINDKLWSALGGRIEQHAATRFAAALPPNTCNACRPG
jgi:hypothetical protein